MLEDLALAATAALALWLYARVRGEAFPLDHSGFGMAGADAAEEMARGCVARVAGIDVAGWRAVAAVWTEDDVRDRSPPAR